MSVIGSNVLAGASGAAGGGDPLYVDDVFSTALYTGNASSNTVPSGLDFTEGSWLSWIKLRNGSDSHFLSDSTQKTGVCFDSFASDRTYGKQTQETTGINAVGASSYSIQGSNAQVNGNTKKYVSWNFKAAPGFFDIVGPWTGNGSGSGTTRTFSHNLGSTPALIIFKKTSHTDNWFVFHKDQTSSSYYLMLDQTVGESNAGTSLWSATDTTLTIADDLNLNILNQTSIAYLFASDDAQFGTDGDESIIKCGKFEAVPGTAVNLGFEPQFLLVKTIDSTRGWFLIDNMRGVGATTNSNSEYLFANTAGSDDDNRSIFITPTGFEVATSTSFANNTHIYMAIRRPHKPPEVGTDVFAMDTFGGTSPSPPTYTSGFPVDFVLHREINASMNWNASTRKTGLTRLRIPANYAELSDTTAKFDQNNGFKDAAGTLTAWQAWMFKRAPGFFDVISYDGTGSNNASINHGLGVVPEMFWIKRRTGSSTWAIYHKDVGAGYSLMFDDSDPSPGDIWQDTGVPTSTQFFTHDSARTNSASNTYTGYFFATLPGISKVGSYSGNTGYAVNVDCGFTNGARFLLIKRTDIVSTGEWYVWDTLRGIVSGNDSYLLLSNQAAEVTNTDYVDPLSTGFTVTSSAPAALNATGGTYIFLAIA